MTAPAELRFWFDPVCPFAWLTSRWVRSVARQREYAVEWRLISLRLLNAEVDYATHFPPGYEEQHTAGLRLLRVVHRARSEHGAGVVGPLYAALGERLFETAPGEGTGGDARLLAAHGSVTSALAEVGLPEALVAALEDDSLDAALRAETEEALALTGRDVGTPIIQVDPPGGTAFFGPVISRVPSEEDAVRLWDYVVGLAGFGGFAELKRSLREQPQLRALGLDEGQVGVEEDWRAGSRRSPS